MTNQALEPVQFLEWDSKFFGAKIGRVTSRNLTDKEIAKVENWVSTHRMDCLYYLADGSKIESSRVAEANGFFLTDLRMTYDISLHADLVETEARVGFREANEKDLPELMTMAGVYHQNSRFFADEHFPREKCQRLYELWLQKDFQEENHFLWIIDVDGHIAGYTSVSMDINKKSVEIGLVGVHSEYRGQGIGLDLQRHVLKELWLKGAHEVEVVTQGRNIAAQNLYIKSGYHLKSVDLWFHKWYK